MRRMISPRRFADLADEYDRKLPQVDTGQDRLARLVLMAEIIRRALWISCLCTIGAILLGYSIGFSLKCTVGAASTSTATFVQAVSAGVILIATLTVRGSEIQTYSGETLSEKVNQWLMRTLFVCGTFAFSLFLGWAA
jgi:hypothetical protein